MKIYRYLMLLAIIVIFTACAPTQSAATPTLRPSATPTPSPTNTLTPTQMLIPPTPTFPAPEGADLPDSAVRSMNEQGQEEILDQPGGDVLWTLIEDENEEPRWQQPTANPEMIAANIKQLDQELSAASAEYVNNLPGVNSPETQSSPSTMVVEYALIHGYEDLHYDQEVGAITALNADGEQVWFFGNAGVVAVQEGPERTADQINLEEGWFVRPERHTLSVEGIDFEVKILNRETGIVYEQGDEEEKVYFQWQEMPEEIKEILLEDLAARFNYRGTIRILIQDDLDGWGLRSEDWAEYRIHNETGYASKDVPSANKDKTFAMMSAEEDYDYSYYAWTTYYRLWLSLIEIFRNEELSSEEIMQLREELRPVTQEAYEEFGKHEKKPFEILEIVN